MADLRFGALASEGAGRAAAFGTLTALCNGTPGQRIRVCPRFWSNSNVNVVRSATGDEIAFQFTRATGEAIGDADDVAGLEIEVGPGGSASGSFVLGARLDPSAARAAAGQYTTRFTGLQARVTYGDVSLGSCTQESQRSFSPANFTVAAVIQSTCTISSGRLDFGTIMSLDRPADAQTYVTLQCTRGTRYEITLEGGRGGGQDPLRRQLASGPELLTYAIYRDSGRLYPWGSSAAGQSISGIGTGGQDVLKIFGRIHANPTAVPGNYSDSLIISVRY